MNDGVFTPTLPQGFAWRVASAATVSLEGEELVLSLTYRFLTATVRAAKASDGHLVLRFVPEGSSPIGYLRVRAGVDPNEAFYGLGEWFDGANHRIVDSMWGTAEESAQCLTVHLFSAPDALDVPRQYYQVTGFPRPPADWATGPWIWRDESRDQAEVEDDVRQLRALDLPTSGMWIDRPYATEVNTFDYEPTRFPDAGGMVSADDHQVGKMGTGCFLLAT